MARGRCSDKSNVATTNLIVSNEKWMKKSNETAGQLSGEQKFHQFAKRVWVCNALSLCVAGRHQRKTAAGDDKFDGQKNVRSISMTKMGFFLCVEISLSKSYQNTQRTTFPSTVLFSTQTHAAHNSKKTFGIFSHSPPCLLYQWVDLLNEAVQYVHTRR